MEGAGSRSAGSSCSSNLLVMRAGFSVLVGDSHPQPSPGHCPKQPRGIYGQQIWPLGLPCQAKETQFIIKREVPFTKKRKGSGALEIEGRAKWQEASLRLMQCPDVPASQPA